MTAETLRALSRTYAAGDLDRDTYKQQRSELLNRVVNGELEVERFVLPEPETPTVFPYDDDDGDTTQEIIPSATKEAEGTAAATGSGATTGGSRALVVSVVLLLVAGVGIYVWQNQDQVDTTNIAEDTPPTTTVTESIAEPAVAVVEVDLFSAFLAANEWDATALEKLRTDFKALSTDSQTSLVDGSDANQIADAFVQQINAENALIGLGDAEGALAKQDLLLSVTEDLGLSDPRFARAREQWQREVDTREANAAKAETAVEETSATPSDTASPASSTDNAISESTVAAAIDEATASSNDASSSEDRPQATQAEPANPAPPEVPQPPANTADAEAPNTSPVTPAKPAPSVDKAAESAASTAAAKTNKTKSGKMRSNCAASLANTRRPYCIDILDSGLKGPVLVVLPRGSFEMGGNKPNESPRHEVTLEQTIAIGLFEVSVKEFKRFCDATEQICPRQPWDGEDLPAVNVSWDLAHEYTRWLSSITKAEYRLPSEAEWEYAARGGTKTAYPFGDELLPTHAHFSFRAPLSKPLAANDRSLNRNEFRLYHIVGNVREWVLDGWTDDYRGAPQNGSAKAGHDHAIKVVRGGSYADGDNALRAAARTSMQANQGDEFTGFRVVRVITK